MKCKYCGATGVKLSHFMKKHKALMLRKMKAGRKGAKRGGSGKHSRKSSGGSSFSHSIPKGYPKMTVTFHH